MSRRKQLNPKPLLKNEVDVQGISEEISADQDNKIACDNEKISSGSGGNVIDKKTMITFPSSSDCETICDGEIKEEPQDIPPVAISPVNNSAIGNQRLYTSLTSEVGQIKVNNSLQQAIFEDSLTSVSTEHKSTTNKITVDDIPNKNLFDVSQKVKVFFCNPCGIGFSSVSTLEAHQAYYCSHRRDLDEDSQFNSVTSSNDKNLIGENVNKSQKTGKQYACLQCSYSADKKVSLNRHMRMHQISPAPSSNTSNCDENNSSQQMQIDRYCSECDIKFSNTKTYRAHKLHYCNTRRSEITTSPKTDSSQKETLSPERLSNSPQISQMIPPFLALPTYPVLVIPYSLIQNASIISDPLTLISSGSNLGTCYSLENGSLKTLATAIATKTTENTDTQRKTASTSALASESPDKITKLLQKDLQKKMCKDNYRETIPLDLSLRRATKNKKQIIKLIDNKKINLDSFTEGKENLSNNQESTTPEHIICAPSLPNSPSLSPSPKRRILSPKIDTGTISNLEIDSLDRIVLNSVLKNDIEMKFVRSSPNIPCNSKKKIDLDGEKKFANITNAASSSNINANIPSAMSSSSPQIFVKQGVSKCKECNIVFCKHENYLVHKQHYCSSRNLDEQDKKIVSASHPHIKDCTGGGGSNAIPAVPYQQLICAACGIKYTSLDNLRAHQSYYCPKGGDKIAIEKKCESCKTFHDSSVPCSETSEISHKCPICDVISTSASEHRKHLESHESVKAFRCSVCKYKGNTLRGMRTHIRMHFDKKKTDFNEENYISCILEDDGIEIISNNSEQLQQNLPQQLYNCDICNYSSSYKGNVLRHTKLVHAEEELLDSTEAINLLPNQVVHNDIVKLEPLELHNSRDPECEDSPTEYQEPSVHSRIQQPLVDDENNLQQNKNSSAQKYCETCDIKFNYMKTFIAHKQFYCKSKQNSENENSSPISSLLNRNKENMETVA